MERLIPVKTQSDILPAYRKTPIEALLAYQNLNRPPIARVAFFVAKNVR